MIHPAGDLVDVHGNVIPNGEIRKRAEDQLKEYITKNKSRFDDFFRAHGPVRPPVRYDLKNQSWEWVD